MQRRRGSTSTTAACMPTRRHVESGRLRSPPHPCYLHPGARRSRHQSAWIPLRRWGRKQCRLRRGIYSLHASCSHVLDVAIGHRIQCLHEAAVNVFDKMSTRYLFLFFLLFPLRIPSLLLYKCRRCHCDSALRWLALSPRQYKSYCQPRPRAALWSCCSHLASEGFSSWNYLVILFPCSWAIISTMFLFSVLVQWNWIELQRHNQFNTRSSCCTSERSSHPS